MSINRIRRTRSRRALGAVLGAAALATTAVLAGPLAPPAHAGLTCDFPIPLPLDDCTPPESVITTKPDPISETRGARFDVTTAPDEAGATFECKLAGPVQAHDWVDCTNTPAEGATTSTGTKVYASLEAGEYTFSVRATDNSVGERNVEQTPASYTWTIELDAVDPGGVPETTITSTAKRWHPFRFLGVRYTSDTDPLGYQCTLDREIVDCGDGQANLLGMGPGDHVFTVTAVDQEGNPDPTPAVSRFSIPQGVASMSTLSEHWKLKGGNGYFLDQYVTTSKKGATYYKRLTKARSLVLVATRCPGCGTLKFTLDGKAVKTVKLDSATRKQRQVIKLAAWSKPTAGRLKMVVVSAKKPVLFEGIGVSPLP